MWRPIIIQSFVSQAGPDHYIICSEPTEKIELGMLVQDNSWSGPLIVERVWSRGKGLTILRCKGRCHLGEDMVRFLVVDDIFLSIPWVQRHFWRKWMNPAIKDRDSYRPVDRNTALLPFPSHRFHSQQSFLNIN